MFLFSSDYSPICKWLFEIHSLFLPDEFQGQAGACFAFIDTKAGRAGPSISIKAKRRVEERDRFTGLAGEGGKPGGPRAAD